MTWLLTVYLFYGDVNQLWLTEEFKSESECRQWQQFYSEYPFKPQCQLIKQGI
jgi:hypothetical protein